MSDEYLSIRDEGDTQAAYYGESQFMAWSRSLTSDEKEWLVSHQPKVWEELPESLKRGLSAVAPSLLELPGDGDGVMDHDVIKRAIDEIAAEVLTDPKTL